MYRKIAFFIVCFMLVQYAHAQELQIPVGIRYKYASDETNQEGKKILATLLEGDPDQVLINNTFAGSAICGPYIWYRLKNYPQTVDLSKSMAPSSMPIFKDGKVEKFIVMEGRVLRTPRDGEIFWEVFKKEYVKGQKFDIRKLSSKELSELWAMIAWDIEEPIFIAESGSTKIIFNLIQKNSKLRLFYIDDFSDTDLKNSIGLICAPQDLQNTIKELIQKYSGNAQQD